MQPLLFLHNISKLYGEVWGGGGVEYELNRLGEGKVGTIKIVDRRFNCMIFCNIVEWFGCVVTRRMFRCVVIRRMFG